jgi:hypothetical protein
MVEGLGECPRLRLDHEPGSPVEHELEELGAVIQSDDRSARRERFECDVIRRLVAHGERTQDELS